MSDPRPPGEDPPGEATRWEKWERWRAGDLTLSDPSLLDREYGLGEPGRPIDVPWRAREGIWIFLLHILTAGLLTVPVALAITDEDVITAIAIMLTELALVVTTLVWVRARYKLGPGALGLRGVTAGNVLAGLGVGILGYLVAAVLAGIQALIFEEVTGRAPPEPDQIPLSEDPTGALLWIVGITVVVLAPVAEEIFFRGFLFAGLRRWARLGPALVSSAVIFSLVHVQPQVLLPIFGLGLLLGWIVERRRSLVPAIVAHLLFNALGFVMLFVV